MQNTLFESNKPYQPLADRLRPQTLAQVVGQQHLVGEGKPLERMVASGHLHSMILWGPPGVGKTTLARILASSTHLHFIGLSAIAAGVAQVRAAVEEAKVVAQNASKGTLLFVDEVHRFNKSQQDAFLPFIEDGTLIFIGATTENPSFELNNALLSRARVYVLKALESEDLRQLLQQALAGLAEDENPVTLEEAATDLWISLADGDGRRLLGFLEQALDLRPDGVQLIDLSLAQMVAQSTFNRFEKSGDGFYDAISALHKSVRGSEPQASLYWLSRILVQGVDPRYVARRLIRMASEDIGLADPRALTLCLDAAQAYERLGSPEGELALAQATVYLAVAAKSNAVYMAFKQSQQAAREWGSLEIPLHLRNAPTKLMQSLDYGKNYRYAHDEPHAYAAGEHYFPDGMSKQVFYQPTDRGLESKIAAKMQQLAQWDAQALQTP